MLISIIITIITTLGLGFLYRMHGGMQPKLPWKFDEILIGLVVALPVLLLTLITERKNTNLNWKFVGAAFTGAILKVKGHGQYMNLQFFPPWPRRITPETWDIFLNPVFGKDPRTSKDWTDQHHATKAKRIRDYGEKKLYLRCLSGLFISGASVSVGLVGVLLYLQNWLPALIVLLLFGLSKPFGYAVGWKYRPEVITQLDEPTEWGEAISGLGAGLAISYLLVFVINVEQYVLTLFNL